MSPRSVTDCEQQIGLLTHGFRSDGLLHEDMSEEKPQYLETRSFSIFEKISILFGSVLQLLWFRTRPIVSLQESTGPDVRTGTWVNTASLMTAARSIFVALRPSILSPPRKRKIYATSWLDGLRGIASFVVVIYHSSQVFYDGNCKAWYMTDPHFFRLPIFRLHCTGTAMVDVFFVVSGYALSYKPLSIARSGDFPRLASSLTSSVFRRGIRLYLPVIAITFLNAMASYLEVFDVNGRDHVPHEETLWATVTGWLRDLLTGLNAFHVDRYRSHDMLGLRYEPAMWTIPYEYRGSIVVFVTLLVFGKVRPSLRSLFLSAPVFYVMAVGQWDLFLFLSGVLCCHLHQCLGTHETIPLTQQNVEALDERRRKVTLLDKINSACGLLIILFVVTIPDYQFGVGDIPFYPVIVKLAPSSWDGLPNTGRLPVCLATVVLVFFVGYSQIWRDALSSWFPQYLGEHSFAIYLSHFFLINTLGRPLMRALYLFKDTIGLKEVYGGVLGQWLALFMYVAIAIPVLFWCGELVTRYVDKKSVNLARWAEEKTFGDTTQT